MGGGERNTLDSQPMIYLITGVPGSGKTLYAVSTLMKTLAAEVVTRSDGTEVKRRLVVDGIEDLQVDHAVMAESDVGEKGRITCEGHGMANWHEWCQPGDVLVVDEVQRYLRPRALGVSPPECIKQLETHRHKGVDFVFITQRPGLIDQNIRQLVGRHQHVRRLFGSNRAVIYDWDGCQADTHRVQGAAKSYFKYPRKAFALYKSSELHTKQRQKIPAWMALPVVAILGGLWFAPQAYQAIRGHSASKPAVAPTKPAGAAPVTLDQGAAKLPSPGDGQLPPASQLPSPGGDAAASSAFVLRMPDEEPRKPLQGCIHLKDRCECFDEDLLRVKVPAGFCTPSAYRVGQIATRMGGGGGLGGAVASPQASLRPAVAPAPAIARSDDYLGESSVDPAMASVYRHAARQPAAQPSYTDAAGIVARFQ